MSNMFLWIFSSTSASLGVYGSTRFVPRAMSRCMETDGRALTLNNKESRWVVFVTLNRVYCCGPDSMQILRLFMAFGGKINTFAWHGVFSEECGCLLKR